MSDKIPMHDVVDICEKRILLGLACKTCVYNGFLECVRFGTEDSPSVNTLRGTWLLSREQRIREILERYDNYFNRHAAIEGF